MVLLWLDNDISGENIWFQIIELILEFLPEINPNNILRAEFSSLASPDIQKAYKNISKYPNHHVSEGFDIRDIIDLRLGKSFTNFQSRKIKKIFGNKSKIRGQYSYGPCIFPTLYFWVKQAEKVRSFEPRNYWKVIVTLKIDDKDTIEVEHVKSFTTFEEVEAVMNKIERSIPWVDVYHKRVNKPKPEPLNTIDLLQLSSRQLGFSVEDTSHYCQTLYEDGYISYPRTESKVYSKNMVNTFGRILESI